MKTYQSPSRQLPLDDGWDVLVVGGGPAGCAAATAAAREGARTLLVEATGCLGGMGTSGLLPFWGWFWDYEKIIHRGIAEKVITAQKAGMPHVAPGELDAVPIDPERLKRVYDDLVIGAGATVQFDTRLAAVEMQSGSTIDAVLLAGKAGLTACRARVYVDCTGDGDLAAWAGAQYEKGDAGGDMQPVTLCFLLANVDSYAYQYGRKLERWLGGEVPKAILDSGKYPQIPDRHFCTKLVGPSTVGFNAGHVWGIDGTDPRSVSRGLLEGRKIAAAIRDALAEFCPEQYGNAFLAATAPLLGVRETRRIIGDYVLTLDDYIARRSFTDDICRNNNFIDVHHTKAELPADREDRIDVEARIRRYAPGETFGIPYRCLTPRGLANALVAGRCVSSDRQVNGSVRHMPTCLNMGEAAGLAAALASRADSPDVHAVDVEHLRARLREEGAYLPSTGDDVGRQT